jgi:zinc ribbon protein
MSSPLGCPRCGFQNTAGYQFCVNCGAPLGPASGTPASSAPPLAGAYAAGPGYAPYGAPVDYDRGKRIERTKTGVLLLLLGSLLSWVPVIGFLGILLILAGAILVILGRKAFGPTHTRNVVLSIVLFAVGLAVIAGVAIVVALSNIGSVIGPGGSVTLTPAFLASSANAGLLGSILGAFILGIAEVLFTYALQAQTGRILLWAAYAANIALAFVLYVILSPLFSAVVTQAQYNAAASTQGTYALLTVIPALLFTGADYLAWSRIKRGEIPAPTPPVPPTGIAPQ